LIILEDGAFGFEPPRPSSDAALEVAVLVQSAGEPPVELAERAVRRLATLERSERVVVEAIIAAGAPGGGETLVARELISREILGHMLRRGSGEIALAAGSDARAELRHELLELAGALTRDVKTASVCIRVLFGPPKSEAEHKSGIHEALVSPPTASSELAEVLAG
jgi:hypothetical protein